MAAMLQPECVKIIFNSSFVVHKNKSDCIYFTICQAIFLPFSIVYHIWNYSSYVSSDGGTMLEAITAVCMPHSSARNLDELLTKQNGDELQA